MSAAHTWFGRSIVRPRSRLLLPQPPIEEWLVDYLEKDRGGRLLWLKKGELAGPFIDGLLESGSSAMRRQGTA